MKKIKNIVCYLFKLRENKKKANKEDLINLIETKNIFGLECFYESLNKDSFFLLREKKENTVLLQYLLYKTPDKIFAKALNRFSGFIYEDLPEEILQIMKDLIQREEWTKLYIIKKFIKENYHHDIKRMFMEKMFFNIKEYLFFIDENNLNYHTYERAKMLDLAKEIISEEKLYEYCLNEIFLLSNPNLFKAIVQICETKENKLKVKDRKFIVNNKIEIMNKTNKPIANKDKKIIHNICENIKTISDLNIEIHSEIKIQFFEDIICYVYKLINMYINNDEYEENKKDIKKLICLLNNDNKLISYLEKYIENSSNKTLWDFFNIICSDFADEKTFEDFSKSEKIKKELKKMKIEYKVWEILKELKYSYLLSKKDIDIIYKRRMFMNNISSPINNINEQLNFIIHLLSNLNFLNEEVGIYLMDKRMKDAGLKYYFLKNNISKSDVFPDFYLNYINSAAEKEIILENTGCKDVEIIKKRL